MKSLNKIHTISCQVTIYDTSHGFKGRNFSHCHVIFRQNWQHYNLAHPLELAPQTAGKSWMRHWVLCCQGTSVILHRNAQYKDVNIKSNH